MKIAILTSGILPVPAVQGGAVENLIDFYLEYNNQHHLHNITVYSVGDNVVKNHPALQSEVNHYEYVDINRWWSKLRKKLYKKTHGKEYYHYTIEYFFKQAYRRILKEHYDLLLLENRPGYSLKIPQDYKVKIVYHIHNDFLNAQTKEAQEIYDRADSIICISDYIKSRVRTINKDDKKCVTVLNGIDLKAFTYPSVVSIHRQDFGLPDDDFVIVFSGRVIKQKGIRQLLMAMNELKEYPHIRLMIIGGSFYGNDKVDSPFIHELPELSASVHHQIIFTGFKPYREIPSLLSLADIAVLPSVWEEPLGLTCIEAMAMGLPVVTTNQGGIPETVTSDCAIILNVDETLPHYIAAAILDLYQHPEKREAMSRAALEHAQRFSKERYAEDFFKAISSI